ncbi:MAG TPA: alpha/beta hydrolase [Solirubrobacteraceae bacterium]|nr:alpha/beta hydrolase [Solirubrobacteraceae bacterium]
MTEPETRILELPGGARLSFDTRPAGSEDGEPPLLMIGAPMDAGGFTALAERFPDRMVVTYDPRGVGRSPRSDGLTASRPEEHADDLRRLISELGGGPADIFASSGGAVNGLALVSRHPDAVRILVAHEPPLAGGLPDSQAVFSVIEDIHDTYEREGRGRAMAKFIAFTSLRGPVPAGFLDQPRDPADFGLPTGDDGGRDHPLLGPHLLWTSGYRPDVEALRRATTRIVVAGGAESDGTFPHRAGQALADRLGTQLVTFPSHHAGFTPEGDPDAFAAALRRVLGAPA